MSDKIQSTSGCKLKTLCLFFFGFLFLFVVCIHVCGMQYISDRLHSVIYVPEDMDWFMSTVGAFSILLSGLFSQ